MRRAAAILVLFSFTACSRGAAPAPKPVAAPIEDGAHPVALFIGDSLTAGFGVDAEDSWPALLDASWRKKGLTWRARNAGVSGETSAGVASEVAWSLTPEVKLVFICIGGNDGLRGLPTAELKKNILALIAPLQKKGLRVALAGMRMPPNFGAERGREFAAVFPDVARERHVPLMPFLLAGVAGDPKLNQGDGIHPNVEGHKIVAQNVAEFLDKEGLLK
jgi:acyl-CoA thioesterase-1